MESKKIAEFIKTKRKEKGLTQEQLANKLFVTEKAISRWETGRGTPDISLLIPLSKELGITAQELLTGEKEDTIESIIEYIEINKKGKYNIPFKLCIISYAISILTFLLYLKLEYDSNLSINYFVRLIIVIISSLFIVIGNYIYSNNYVDKIKDNKKIEKLSILIIAIYYCIMLFNMTIFSRINRIDTFNLIPFKSIFEIITNGNYYSLLINILGNFVVFMPLEYFLIKLLNINKFKLNLLISLMIIILCEIIQYIFKIGVFDIDDIILCTCGMMTFYFIYNKNPKFDKNKYK